MSRATLRISVTIMVALVLALVSASCSSDDERGRTNSAMATGQQPEDALSSTEEGVVEITAVEYAFQGVPDTVAVGTELRLFNAGERVHALGVEFVGGETAPLDQLLPPPQGALVGAAFAMPGDRGLSLQVPDDNSRPVPGPITLDTPGRYVLYSPVTNGGDFDTWRAFIAGIEEGGRLPGFQPPSGPGEPDFAKGMVADIIVQGEAGEPTVLEVLQADGRFGILHDLLVNHAPVRFEAFLSQPTWNLTLLAPTDDAFNALPGRTLDGLKNDRDTLTRVLQQHAVLEYLESADIVAGEVKTVVSDLTITTEGSTVRFDDATVIEADVVASNGVIHVIDKVLVPEGTSLEGLAGN